MPIDVKCSVFGRMLHPKGEPEPCDVIVSSVDDDENEVSITVKGKTIRVDGMNLVIAITNALRNQ